MGGVAVRELRSPLTTRLICDSVIGLFVGSPSLRGFFSGHFAGVSQSFRKKKHFYNLVEEEEKVYVEPL
jgi:hypothetical protein